MPHLQYRHLRDKNIYIVRYVQYTNMNVKGSNCSSFERKNPRSEYRRLVQGAPLSYVHVRNDIQQTKLKYSGASVKNMWFLRGVNCFSCRSNKNKNKFIKFWVVVLCSPTLSPPVGLPNWIELLAVEQRCCHLLRRRIRGQLADGLVSLVVAASGTHGNRRRNRTKFR